MLKERIAHFQAKVDELKVTKEENIARFEKGLMKVTEYNARMIQINNTIEVYENKVVKLIDQLPKTVTCSKCGKQAFKQVQVRDEEDILLAVKYHHEMIPSSGYAWTCTQVMEYEPIHDYKGSVKKEMEKRPYVFKSRDAKYHNDLYGRKVGN